MKHWTPDGVVMVLVALSILVMCCGAVLGISLSAP